jgi:hypothetical protein
VPHQLSEKLLASFQDEAQRLREHKSFLSDPLKGDRELVESTQQIFRQILREGLGLSIASFSQDEKQEALEALDGVDESNETITGYIEPFVELFAELCDQWPDVIDVSYGGSPSDFREFRVELVPALLEALANWVRVRGDSAFAEQTTRVHDAYVSAIEESSRGSSEWEV